METGRHSREPLERSEERQLHACPQCESEMVYPTDWEEQGPDAWTLSLRCPNCEWTKSGTFEQEAVEALEERLDDGIDEVVSTLNGLARENLVEDIDRFVAALDADAILPIDF